MIFITENKRRQRGERDEQRRALRRQTGAAAVITHYYRAHRIRTRLATLLLWNKHTKATVLQKYARRHAARKIYKRLLRSKQDRERRVQMAAAAIQKIFRGRRARRVYRGMVMVRAGVLLEKRRAKSDYLRNAAANAGMRAGA